MTPRDIWWMIDSLRPRKTFGAGNGPKLTEEQMDEIYSEMFPEELQ